MPINSLHPEYRQVIDQWTRCKDVVAGSDAIKAKGVKYLPRLGAQSTTEYGAYKTRALFFSAAGRSLDGLVGMLTRRMPTLEYSSEMKKYFIDVDMTLSFEEVRVRIARELLLTGRVLTLIDWPKEGGDPYITTFSAEQVINWQTQSDGSLLWAVVQESVVTAPHADKYALATVVRYRLLDVSSGEYVVTVYDSEMNVVEAVVPKVRNMSLTSIPGMFVTPEGITAAVVKPPILDIVDVNLSQYLTSADLEHGRHFTALPTPVISGASSDTKLKIGGQTAWSIPEKAKAYFLEFQGLGLTSLERAISEKTSQMAQFSTRLMDTSSRGSEAVDTVKLRHSSEAATLTSIANAMERALIILYTWIATFEDFDIPTILLNKDFLNSKLSHLELKQLTESYISGAIDEDTYFFNLYRGELVNSDKKVFTSKPADSQTSDQ